MIREVIEDAIARGEKLKKDIVGQILKSETFNDLVNNPRFTQTIMKVIQTKNEITHTIQKNVQEALRTMNIPSKSDLSHYEKRVDQLEKKLDSLGRGRASAKKKSGSRR